VKVEPAIDHKAKTQFEGKKKTMAIEIASAYSISPLAQHDGMKMTVGDWIRKEEFQNMDHAADGKKKLSHCAEWKKEVITEDLGRSVLQFQASLSALSREDISEAQELRVGDVISK